MRIRLGNWTVAAALLAQVGAAQTQATPQGRDFTVSSADGIAVHGTADTGGQRVDQPPRLVIIFVPGTGLFDRDASLGTSQSPRDLVFKDLAGRMRARGVATVRYDVRGVRYAPEAKPEDRFDRAILAGRTTTAMRDDLAAIYRWAGAADGLGARCVGFFAHSEGMLHVARLTALELPAPTVIIGMGAGMESPARIVRWQLTGRDADSLELMDADRDGVTTNDEVRENIDRTPAGVNGKTELYLHPSGRWTKEDLVTLRATQMAIHERVRGEVLSHADNEPYPNAEGAFSAYEWWKSWFVDDEPAARLLARWQTPISLHYGDRDSQTPAISQIAAARAHLPAAQLRTTIHPDRGHTLGSHVLLGPIDEAIADRIADEAAAAMAACAPG